METYKIKVAQASALMDFIKQSEQEKVAIPLTPLLGAAFTLPSVYEVGSNVVGGLADGMKGDTDAMGKKLMIAGLAGLSAMPFVGSAAKGVGHIGRAFKVHAKKGRIPSWMPGAGEPGKFVKAVRTPHNKILEYTARMLGPDKSRMLGEKLLEIGHIGNIQPFRWMDRGFRNGGLIGKLAPSIGSSVAIDYFSAPKRQQLYDELAQQGAARQVTPTAQHAINAIKGPGALQEWLDERRDSQERLRQIFEPQED